MTETRLLGADFLRAAACLTVFFHHLAQRMSWGKNLGWMEWFRPFANVGAFGVAMFFVLSGFLLARPFWVALDRGEPMPSLRVYAMRRAARILPGYWVALLVSFVLSITVFGAALDGQLVLRLLAGFFAIADWHWVTLFPVEVNGPLWSISFEVTSYLLLPVGFALLFLVSRWTGQGWQSRLTWICVIALTVLLHGLFVLYYPIDTYQRSWDYGLVGGAKFWMPRYNPIGFFAMFAIGALAAGLQVRWAKYRNGLFGLLTVLALAWAVQRLVAQHETGNSDSWGWLGIPYGFPWFALAVALFLASAPSSLWIGKLLDNGPVRYISRISFGIYVWHNLVLELTRTFWDPQFQQGTAADPLRFVITSSIIIGITVLIAHASYTLLEEPVIRWARTRERRSGTRPALSPAVS